MGENLKKGQVAVSFRRKLMTLKWKDMRDVCMLSSIHNEEMQTVRDKKGEEKQKPKVCIDYNGTMGSVDLSDQYNVTYSTRKRIKKYYQKIFHHLLYLTVFSSLVIFRKHGGKYTHLQFHMHTVQKLFEKYGGATSSEALSVRTVKTLHPDPSRRFTGGMFLM
jgi:hypothetical protein